MLKQLLQLLLNTRTTPSEAAHNAAPGRIDIGISGQEYICPADGFVTASANAKNVGGFNMQLFRNGLSVQGGPQDVSVPAWTQAAMIPVAKGDTVNISLYNQNSWQWRFISSIGMVEGGGKFVELLYGGSVCLRALSNYLPKVSSRANPSGSAANPIHQGVSHSQALSRNTSLPQTVFWGFTKIKRPRVIVSTFIRSDQRAKSSQEQLLHSLLPQISLLSQLSYLLRRAIGLLLRVPSMSFGSHQQWGANSNLSTGGALC